MRIALLAHVRQPIRQPFLGGMEAHGWYLAEGLMARGHRRVLGLDQPDDLATLIADESVSGDMVVCLGAGTITTWANALPEQLALIVSEPQLMGGSA